MYSSQSLIALASSQYHLEHPYFHKFKNGKIQEKTSLPNLFYLLLVIQVSCFFQEHGFKHNTAPLQKRPTSLDEWLAGLNLSCYEQNFISSGWDSLLYMHELTQTDLVNMGVSTPEHQQKLLTSVQDLNKV